MQSTLTANIVPPGYDKDKCPFGCGKDPHDFGPHEKDKANEKVKSIPKNLDVKSISPSGTSANKDASSDRPYTIAAHHLISAKQCFARLPALVRMATGEGYDINADHNGIGLPTTHWTLKYPSGATRKKYGDLGDSEKTVVAEDIMREVGAQWHVGHHAFEIKWDYENQREGSAEDFGDEVDNADDLQGHDYPGYDAKVIEELTDIMFKYFSPQNPFCEENESEKQIEEELKNLSKEIKRHLDMMHNCKSSNPSFGKCDYFVSKKAAYFYERLRRGE